MSVRDATPTLEVAGLTVTVETSAGVAEVLSDVSFEVGRREAVGLVGESGSGKTMTGLALMGLLPTGARVSAGDIRFNGERLVGMSREQMRRLRGSSISMVLQDPMAALDPSFTIGNQIDERLRLHRKLRGDAARAAAVAMLGQVRIPAPEQRLGQYPHELSGGMLQRICSAIALIGDPELFIADEPTTALDVTTQARYLDLLRQLQTDRDFAMIFISHDLSIVEELCSNVVVMYAGQIVESGPVDQVFGSPAHPYTAALLTSLPKPGAAGRPVPIRGHAPDVHEYPTGCRFAPRCPHARPECAAAPPLTDRDASHRARCFGSDAGGWIAVELGRAAAEVSVS